MSEKDEEEEKKISFNADPRIIDVLGQQLIPNNGIGIAELVKNSYDADATQVEIHLGAAFAKNLEETCIVIRDNGLGMSEDDLSNKFFQLAHNVEREKLTPRGRIKVGEKGIGKLATQRLGRKLILYTKKKEDVEYRIEINWDLFDDGNENNLGDVEFDLKEDHKDRQFMEDEQGTILLIGHLRERFDGNDLQRMKREVNYLVSPFPSTMDFQIDLQVPKDREQLASARLGTKAIARSAPFRFRGHLTKNGLLEYEFENRHPWSNKSGSQKQGVWSDWEDSILTEMEFDFSIFNKTSALLYQMGIEKKELNSQVGIRLYRNGLRVYPYGENNGKNPVNDWLGITRERAQNPNVWFGEDQCIGAISFRRTREINWDLKDKTDRSGMVENKHWDELKKISKELVKKIKKEFMSGEQNPSIRPKPPQWEQPGLGSFGNDDDEDREDLDVNPPPINPPLKPNPRLPKIEPMQPKTSGLGELESVREEVVGASVLISQILRDLDMNKSDVKERIEGAKEKLEEAQRKLEE